jgi:hypothetical protein
VRTAWRSGVRRASSACSLAVCTASASPYGRRPSRSGRSRINTAIGSSTTTDATSSSTMALRQPKLSVRPISAGRKINCPIELAAANRPMITPRRARNQRCATVAPSTLPTAPVPRPVTMPQNRNSCQIWVMKTSGARPSAIRPSPASMTRRGPNRSTSPPPSGPPRPKARMLTATASEIAAGPQPNSASSGLISTPGAARTPAAVSSVRTVTATTTQA